MGQRRWIAGFAAFCLAVSQGGCGGRTEAARLPRYEATFLSLFDTVTTIVGYGGSKETFTANAQLIHDELEAYHQLYDIYHTYDGVANLKTINDLAGIAPVRVDRRIIDLLLEAKELYVRTGGEMNVAFGSVLSIWHEFRIRGIDDPEHATLPAMEALRVAAQHTDIEKIEIDQTASTVFLADPEMRLDVGAIAKGYAVERVCRGAREQGIKNLLVSVGGNVCAVGGMDGFGAPWRVGVQNPDHQSGRKYLCRVGLRDRSLVTSGGSQRYYTVDGVQYHHIIDPKTLMPARYFWAVSVIAKDSGAADALSTALYNLPYTQGHSLAERFPDIEALWVMPDGTQKMTDGFDDFILK